MKNPSICDTMRKEKGIAAISYMKTVKQFALQNNIPFVTLKAQMAAITLYRSQQQQRTSK